MRVAGGVIACVMMASDTNRAGRPRRQPNWNVMAPLIYAPLIPLLRIGLNGRVAPRTRDAVFASSVLLALAHAGWVMSGDSTMSTK